MSTPAVDSHTPPAAPGTSIGETSAAPVDESAKDSFHLPPKSSPSLRDVARRVSSRTTDLLAVGLIIIASLTIGRQAVNWYQAEPPMVLPPRLAAADERLGAAGPVALEFADQPSTFFREEVHGDVGQARDHLRAIVLRRLLDSAAPTGEPDRAEQSLLATVAALQPVATEPGRWSVYQVDELLSMVVGVRLPATVLPSAPKNESAATAPPSGRVICWGLALPRSANEWTVFAFERRRGAPGPEFAPLPLPSQVQKVMSVRDAQGQSLATFEGETEWTAAPGLFDAWLQSEGYERRGEWQSWGATLAAHFHPRHNASRGELEVHLTPGTRRHWSGLMISYPPTRAAATRGT